MTALIALGLCVGLIMALTGAGGGILAVPLLVFVTGLPVQAVAPIGLLAIALAAAVAAAIGLKAGQVRYKAALLMGATGLLTSPLGFWLAQRVDSAALGLAFAVVLVWVAFNAFRTARLLGNNPENAIDAPPDSVRSNCPCIQSSTTGRFIWTIPCARALVFSGGLAGLLSGLLGVGGGFVLVPALQRFTNLGNQSVALTSLAVIAMVSSFGVFNSAGAGTFNYAVGVPFAASAVAGMLCGRLLAGKTKAQHLKQIFGVLCLGVAMMMVLKNL
jgi:uncharacterized protein